MSDSTITKFSATRRSFTTALLLLLLVMTAAADASPSRITVSAGKATGNPGDKIVTWKIDASGNSVRRVTLRMDGQQAAWTSPRTWTALPGTLAFHIQVCWEQGSTGRSEPYALNYSQVEIAGGDSDFIRHGICSSQSWIGYLGPYGGQNQGTAMARNRMAPGIILNDRALFDTGVHLLFEIQFNNRAVLERHSHPVNLVGLTVARNGEIMEFNRDAAHSTGSPSSLINGAEILRHQHVDPKYNLCEWKEMGGNHSAARERYGILREVVSERSD